MPATTACIGKPGVEQAKTTAIAWVDKNATHIADVSHTLWEYKEVGLTEFKSSDLLVSELEANGFTVERGQAGMPTAFVGTYTHGTGKPVIGILAEYDALPNGHSCGHNLYGAGSVAAAIAAKEAMEKHGIDGTIKLFGTPSEDTHGGKVWLAREGVFNGCDVMLTWHPGTQNIANYGTDLAVQILQFDFYGKASHAGAAPEMGRSALDALEIFSIGMEFLREHMIEPMRIQYIITKGGAAPNVVPDYAQMKLVIRGPTMADIEYLRSRDGGVDDCARAGALATGCDVTVQVVGGFYNQVPNEAGANLLYENLKAIEPPTFTAEEEEFVASVAEKYDTPLGKLDTAIYMGEYSMGKFSADTGDVSYIVPLISLGTACAAVGSPGHSLVNVEQYGMSIGQKGAVYAAKVLACTVLDLLIDATKTAAVVAEFKKRIGSVEYHAVIPIDLWPPIPTQNPSDFKGPAPTVHPKPAEPESMLFWKTK
jgi:aminobenzoyl-glutamate utilization protein B